MTDLAVPTVSDGGLTAYFRAVRSFPLLEAEEEYMLAKRWREHQDVEAAHKLVTSHLRLVVKMAVGYRHYGLPVADLIGEGNVGLMRAVKKFDPEMGVRLATYAMWWIKASLHEYILASWSLVKIGSQAAHRKLFFNLRRLKAKLRLLDSTDLEPEQARRIATELSVGEDEVQMMNRRLSARDSSLNAPVMADGGGAEVQDLLPDESADQESLLAAREEAELRRAWLRGGLAALNEREREIVVERRLRDDPATLEELGQRFGISRERVRQIESKALAKLERAVRDLAEAA